MEQYTNPRIWGPHFWFILKCITHNYPMSPTAQDKEHMESFFYELQFVLPCEKCKYTFKQHYNKYPINKYLSCRTKLIEWLELIYDETNRSIANNRVKIMDEYIDTGEMVPIKQNVKSDTDKILEQHLRDVTKKVTANTLNANLTTFSMLAAQPVDNKPKFSFEPKIHSMTTENPNFGKQVNGKKIPVINTNTTTQNVIPNMDLIINANKNLIPNQVAQRIEIPPNDKIAMQKQVFNQIVQPQNKLITPTPIFQNTTQIPKNPTVPKPTPQLPKYNTNTNTTTVIPPVKKNITTTTSIIQSNPIKPEQKIPKPNLPLINKSLSYEKPKPNNLQKYEQSQTKPKAKTLTYSNLKVISKCQKCKQ